ncbi:unnamed protein product [Rotaria socialis]|uniref:Uncharacterized protein n=1 Tax=Rotaria socialis TaxID=392032 RepID=A0A821C8M2_9BILA|nr:unnamed protein product [Rotaria socialis]CAF3580262.1 unnamed protein product [Rotaria socialis]CAF4251105.1 unnamed protein product [Rotaria socialis]CAF4598743.1 unnamed protein product [Rotaria socialis]
MIPLNQPPVTTENHIIRGDPAARRFGLVLFGTLALITIGAGLGIGLGNIAHYRYFSPYTQTALNYTLLRQLI